jgi:hypothetical protein
MNVSLANFDFLSIGIAILALLEMIALIILFWIHRKNSINRITKMEEQIQMLEYKLISTDQEQIENLKKALQLHLGEISERMRINEMNINKLTNQLDALRESFFEDESDEEVLPENDAEETNDEIRDA